MVSLLVSPGAAAAECTDLDALELSAARRRLDPEMEACLEGLMGSGEVTVRARASFVLILSAYSGQDLEVYGERMRRHLSALHTTDAEVAYLFARYLWKKSAQTAAPPYTAEILRWSRVAMDGRTRWLHNRRNYDEMVRNLYDMLVQSSLQQAMVERRAFDAAPTDAQRLVADRAKRRARHYLIVAAPCLHKGECGPTFEVYVEGLRECDDLGPLENYARAGRLDDGHRACLRARFRRPASPKRRILDLLIEDADQQSDPGRFEFLLAWHWNLTDSDDPEMAYRFARWLSQHQGDGALLAQWSEAGLEASRANVSEMTELYQWRVQGWSRVAAAAKELDASQSTERSRRELSAAESGLKAARVALTRWCDSNGCPER